MNACKTREGGRLRIAPATAADREAIYRCRHEIYARELHQHPDNTTGRLTDALDDANQYLCAWREGVLAGFISITPPGAGRYSVGKYLGRERMPFAFDDRLYEVRLLTVMPPARGGEVAALLMYAAFRWVEAHGGTRIVAIGRREVLGLYRKVGLLGTGMFVTSGRVTFEVLHAPVAVLREHLARFDGVLRRGEDGLDWQVDVPFRLPAPAFHGGAFFGAIGERFDHLDRRLEIINADVLDAWFPPAPGVLSALREHLPWLLSTSPPTHAEGLAEVIADCRGVRPENVLPGAGSSDLIFLAFRRWLDRGSRALVLDPTYGEYPHVLEHVVGCRVDRLPLHREDDYRVPLDRLAAAVADGYGLIVLVNPNSPTGRHIPRPALESMLRHVPEGTRVWVDETYLEYAGAGQSLEAFAARSPNVVVCKSMSKVYALSGARAAYLCAAAHQIEALRAETPPWAVSLPAQVAAVAALRDPAYYAGRYLETHALREGLARGMAALGWDVVPGCANFLLAHLPADGPVASEVVEGCRRRGLFIRDAASMSRRFGGRVVRVAVKDAATNGRMMEIVKQVWAGRGPV